MSADSSSPSTPMNTAEPPAKRSNQSSTADQNATQQQQCSCSCSCAQNITENSATVETRFPITKQHTQFRKDPSKYHLIIGVTGSVAAIKLPALIKQITDTCGADRLSIRVVCTRGALHFIEKEGELPAGIPVYTDEHEWTLWQARSDPVLHIELRKWADSLLIAPLDANTMAKLAGGICDNLLTCLARAWEPCKPLLFAPAMNTYMYEHPLTYKHLEVLKGLLQYKEIPCVAKELMCGETGLGGMAEPRMIASIVNSDVKNKFSFVSYH